MVSLAELKEALFAKLNPLCARPAPGECLSMDSVQSWSHSWYPALLRCHKWRMVKQSCTSLVKKLFFPNPFLWLGPWGFLFCPCSLARMLTACLMRPACLPGRTGLQVRASVETTGSGVGLPARASRIHHVLGTGSGASWTSRRHLLHLYDRNENPLLCGRQED